jgi:putative transcriptional regulator
VLRLNSSDSYDTCLRFALVDPQRKVTSVTKREARPSFYERLKEGLEQGIRHARGEIKLRTTVLVLPDPPPKMKARDIVRLRNRYDLSQFVFARVLNVSEKTVQSWEKGERKPSQAALRLLEIVEANPEMATRIINGNLRAG